MGYSMGWFNGCSWDLMGWLNDLHSANSTRNGILIGSHWDDLMDTHWDLMGWFNDLPSGKFNKK